MEREAFFCRIVRIGGTNFLGDKEKSEFLETLLTLLSLVFSRVEPEVKHLNQSREDSHSSKEPITEMPLKWKAEELI